MITHGSLEVRSASSPAEIRTSVMAGLSFFTVAVRVDPKTCSKLTCASSLFQVHLQNLRGVLQHLAKLLGGGGDDRDEVSLAQPALGAMALDVTAGAAMKHRRMRGGDAGLADVQAKRHDPTPVVVGGVERVARQRHG